MSKIRLLPDHVSNQIAAGEVVERPASVAKELVENAIDARATRIVIDVESGGRRLLKVSDDGEGMVRDDALLAFERHATSKISTTEDLNSIATLGFRGEALASIASVARVELISRTEDAAAATRVVIEGGRMRDVKDAAHPRGTTLSVRDLFFNVPARRKFLRSEATETFHLTNLVTHYALAHPEIEFTLTNGGREVLRVASAKDLRERAYQIFGSEFLDNLLEVSGGHKHVALVSGYVSAPRDRRTSRDAQYLFVNGRFVRDQLIGRALSEGYRSILPHGVYPAALLFIETPLEEVDVNVHPAKTEVRFRRVAAVADAVREAVRSALASAGYMRADVTEPSTRPHEQHEADDSVAAMSAAATDFSPVSSPVRSAATVGEFRAPIEPSRQSRIEFASPPIQDEEFLAGESREADRVSWKSDATRDDPAIMGRALSTEHDSVESPREVNDTASNGELLMVETASTAERITKSASLPPLASADKFAREVTVEELSSNIRPLGQLDESFIIATDDEGLLLIDQHVAHERILFDKYRALESSRLAESQHLLIPETFDLTPGAGCGFDFVAPELESYGFELMRLSGRTVAIKATPRCRRVRRANMLAEMETVDSEKKGSAREALRDDIAASLACHAAIKVTCLWLLKDALAHRSAAANFPPTTCPHGRPVNPPRLAMRDIFEGFHRI